MNSTEVAMKLGEWLAPIMCIAIGYGIARRVNRAREFDRQVKWPIVTGFVFAGLMLLGQCTPKSAQAPAMGDLERQKRADGDIVGNISFDRKFEPDTEMAPLPLSDEALAQIDDEVRPPMVAELNRRGLRFEDSVSVVSENLTFREQKFYTTQVQGNLTEGQGGLYVLVVSGRRQNGVGVLTCTSLDGAPFKFVESPCADEAAKFFELGKGRKPD